MILVFGRFGQVATELARQADVACLERVFWDVMALAWMCAKANWTPFPEQGH